MTTPRTLGRDPAFKTALRLAEKAAQGRSPVVLVGRTGSGKSHLARYLHARRPDPQSTFLEWNAGGVPAELLEANLFGMEKGTATGVSGRRGVFEAVGNGTLCLTGIEMLHPSQQAALLRVLEGGILQRIGGTKALKNQALIIASFSEPPEILSAKGLLRPDLLYRLDVMRIHIPDLCERSEDIPVMAGHFLRLACRRLKRSTPNMSAGLLDALCAHRWPGNVRELAQRMEGLALAGGDPLTAEDLPGHFWVDDTPLDTALKQRLTLDELKDAYIRSVLARVGGNRTQAARWLGISRKSLWAHLRREPT